MTPDDARDDKLSAERADDAMPSNPLEGSSREEGINVELLKENFAKFLKREGLKNTPERHIVLECIARMEEHFDVDRLCAQLYTENSRISKATVYRTVELLVKGGFIKRVIYGERQARYEWNYQVKYHEHLICVNCSFIFEFYNPELERMKGSIAEALGFRPKESLVEIRGICKRYERDGACEYHDLSQKRNELTRGTNRIVRLQGEVALRGDDESDD